MENIYPKLNEVQLDASAPVEGTELERSSFENDLLKVNINKLRIENFLNEKRVLEELLSHYNKLKNKWTKVDSSLKYFILSSGGALTIISTILPVLSGFGILPTIALYCGAGVGLFTTINSGIEESFHIGLSSKKKKIYREICEAIKHCIDKLYFFQLKALEDNILTDEEINKAKDIIKDLREEILKIKQNNIN